MSDTILKRFDIYHIDTVRENDRPAGRTSSVYSLAIVCVHVLITNEDFFLACAMAIHV